MADDFDGWCPVEEFCSNGATIRYLKTWVEENVQKEEHDKVRAVITGRACIPMEEWLLKHQKVRSSPNTTPDDKKLFSNKNI